MKTLFMGNAARLFLCTLSFLSASAHSPSADEGKPPLILERADYIRQRLEDGKTVVILEGDVRWVRGESRLRCGWAKYFEADGLLYLARDVYLFDDDRSLRADSVRYRREDGNAVAQGHVHLELDGGDVTVSSDSMAYQAADKEAWALKRPRLDLRSRPSGEESEDIMIRGDRLHMREGEYIAVSGMVDISGDSLIGRSDSLYYDLLAEEVSLVGDPWIEAGSYRVEGRRIVLRVPDRVLRKGISQGDARGEERQDAGVSQEAGFVEEPISWVEADTITLTFRQERIDSLLAYPGARSFFRENREGGREENYAVGEAILLVWKDGQVDQVRVSGKGEGVYRKRDSGEEQVWKSP